MTQDLIGEYAIKQGATYRATIIWKTGATVAAALPVNLTGYHSRCMFKSTAVKKASLIDAITKANPGVVTTQAAHKLVTGQSVVLPNVGGMVELIGRYTITVLTPTTFSIGTNTSTYTTYTSGGSVAFVSLTDVLSTEGQLIQGTTGGDTQIHIKDTVTDVMSGGGVYDLEMLASNGDVVRTAEGMFETSLNVTR